MGGTTVARRHRDGLQHGDDAATPRHQLGIDHDDRGDGPRRHIAGDGNQIRSACHLGAVQLRCATHKLHSF